VPLRLVGVIGKLYVILESDRGLVLLDQHAAHERILFEQMLSRLEQMARLITKIAAARNVELSPRDANFYPRTIAGPDAPWSGPERVWREHFSARRSAAIRQSVGSKAICFGMVDELKSAGQEVNSLRLGEQTSRQDRLPSRRSKLMIHSADASWKIW